MHQPQNPELKTHDPEPIDTSRPWTMSPIEVTQDI